MTSHSFMALKEEKFYWDMQVALYSNLWTPRNSHLFFPSSFVFQYGQRTLLCCFALTSPHIAGEYLTKQ